MNYIKNLNIHLYDYLYSDQDEDFDKDSKNKKLKDDMIKYKFNMNDLLAYANDLYQEYLLKNEIPNEDDLINTIDIYSPLFEPFSLKQFFEKLFFLSIPIKIIKNFNLSNDYILAFDKLNKLDSNYPTFELHIKDGNDIEYLKRLNINFNKLKKIVVNIDADDEFIGSYNCLFENLFTLPDIQHSLVSLEIKGGKPQKDYNINSYSDEDVENEEEGDEIIKIFENLNKLESLEKLRMTDFNFEKKFTLKLYNLKELILYGCSNIAFDENSCLNLKILYLECNKIIMPEKSLKFPELEKLGYSNNSIETIENSENNEDEFEGNEKSNNLIDFGSLKKLKELIVNISNFGNFINSPLESVEIYEDRYSSSDKENEKKMIENILTIKTLKKVEIKLDKISSDEILEIEGENNSVEELRLDLNVENTDYDFYNLQKKFPNLSLLNYHYTGLSFSFSKFLILEIIEDSSFKVNKLSISGEQYTNNKFYIESFSSLKLISIDIHSKEIKNLEEAFPFFNSKCQMIFKSLTEIKFYYYADSPDNNKANYKLLMNLYYNLDMMPNLKIFYLTCNTEGVDEFYYEKFIKKLLSMKLDEIRLNIQIGISNQDPTGDKYYTKKELKQINPNINYYELNNNISICKLRKC